LSYRERVVFLLLLIVEHAADSLHSLILQGTQAADAIATRDGPVTAEAENFLLPLFEDGFHRCLLRLIQVERLGKGLNLIVQGGVWANSPFSRLRGL
jgi:hypothetical protein